MGNDSAFYELTVKALAYDELRRLAQAVVDDQPHDGDKRGDQLRRWREAVEALRAYLGKP